MNNNTSQSTPPQFLSPRSHSHLLSAFLVTLNILLVFFLFFYFSKFFWQKQSSNPNPNDDTGTNSSISSPPSSPRTGRALDQLQFINSLPVIEFKNDGTEKLECAVCLAEFKDEEKIRVLPKCNHRFHIECVDRWFKSNANCPLCRTPIESKDCSTLDSVV